MIGIVWFFLTKVFYRTPDDVTVDHEVIVEEKRELGPISYEEKWIAAVFATTALLWVFRADLNVGLFSIPGWSRLLENPGMIDDGAVAIAMASVLFFIPARNRSSGAQRLMEPDVVPKLPWDIVLLFGGGFALAAGFQRTGLALLIGNQFELIGSLPPFLMILLVCLAITFLTELTSNLATTEMILPILAAVAVATEIHPLILMIPATLSASCAFMMPVATPPNAIVFGSGRLTVGEMARIGIVLNLIGAVVITVIVFTIGTVVFDIDPTIVPEWARSIASGVEG
jgi:sodium-dependent dicarboxylate transporter 2/3/5